MRNVTLVVFLVILFQGVAWSECAFTRDGGGHEGFTNDAGICVDMVHWQVFDLEVWCLDDGFEQIIWRGRPQPGDFIDTLGCYAIRVRPYTRRQRSSEELFEGCVVQYSTVMWKDGHSSRQGPRSEHNDWDFSLVNQRDGYCRQSADPAGYRIHPHSEGTQTWDSGSDEAFVVSLYRNILDREPDDGGLRHWLEWLAKGKSRQWVMEHFFESNEYQSRRKSDHEYVRDLYQATRFREPTDGEMRDALTRLSRGESRSGLLARSLGSTDIGGAGPERNRGTHFSCQERQNQEGKCCCFTGYHTYRFAERRVSSVAARFDTGKKFDCRSTVKFDVHSGGRWVTLQIFDAVSSRGGDTRAPNDVSVAVNRVIDGFRMGDDCRCCIDSSEIWLH
jgi:hypothetical protein